jgi:hypothetical protein
LQLVGVQAAFAVLVAEDFGDCVAIGVACAKLGIARARVVKWSLSIMSVSFVEEWAIAAR